MAETRSGRDECDIHKDEIHKLYIEDGRKLSDVAVLMTHRHGFKRTKAQYERIFKQWGMKKYDSKEDWVFIAEHVKNRKNQGRESEVKIRGELIPMLKVKRQISRYEYLSAPYKRPTSNRNMTPPHICIYTPPGSPEPIPATLVGPLYYQDPVQMPNSSDNFTTWAKLTPWYQFMRFIRMLNPEDPITIFSNKPPTRNQRSVTDSGSAGSEPTELIARRQVSKTQDWIDDITVSSWVQLDTQISPVYSTLRSYLPPTLDGSVDINMKDMYDISRRSTQLECIKLVTNLISNNHDTSKATEVIVELTQDRSNLLALKGLFNQKLPIADAVAENLLVSSARYQNFPLLRTLVEHGIDVDSFKFSDGDYNALAYAIHNCEEDVVTYLLDHGADASKEVSFFHHNYLYESTLDFATACGNINMVEDILTSRSGSRPGCPDITVRTFRLATLLGDVSIMELFMDRNPGLLDEMKSKAWLLSEAAAIHKTTSTLTYLQNLGIDITATDDFGKGSALAVACYNANMPLIYRLLDLGADINGVALGDIDGVPLDDIDSVTLDHILDYYCTTELEWDKLHTIRAKASLHIAVEMNHEELVQFLLDKGADPNQCCRAYPLQIAAQNGRNVVAKMLLGASANVDSVPQTREMPYQLSDTSSKQNLRVPWITKKPAVQLALERGWESVFFTLVEGGAEIPSKTNPEFTVRDAKWNPLQSAIIGGNQNLVRYITESAKYNYQGTPECLVLCIRRFGCDFTRMLIDNGRFTAEALHDPQVLCNSVYRGDIELVRSLFLGTKLSLGGLPPGYGAAGMALAVRLRKEAMVGFFLDAGVMSYGFTYLDIQEEWEKNRENANVNDTQHWNDDDKDGWKGEWKYDFKKGTSALQQAFMVAESDNSQQEQSRNLWSPKVLMVECKAILKDMKRIAQNRGILIAYGAAIATGRLDILNIVLDTGLDVREIDKTVGFGEPDKPHCTSLQILLCEYDPEDYEPDRIYEVAMALLKHGAVPDCLAEGTYGFCEIGLHTPLQYAAKLNDAPLVRKLLDMGADVNAKPNIHRGATALQFAAINGNFEIVNILLEAGANINASPADYGGRSAIEGASERGRLDMAIYLLEAGANVHGKANKNYRGSVYRAWQNGHMCLARMIQDWKTKRFGADDCEDVHVIVESMQEFNPVDLGIGESKSINLFEISTQEWSRARRLR